MNDLDGIKAGDKVAVRSGGASRHVRIVTVDKVTPTGRIRVGDRMYRADGWECGAHGYYTSRLSAVTPELQEDARRQVALARFGEIRAHLLTTETLEAIFVLARDGRLP